jgi:hypothetical protein
MRRNGCSVRFRRDPFLVQAKTHSLYPARKSCFNSRKKLLSEASFFVPNTPYLLRHEAERFQNRACANRKKFTGRGLSAQPF